ncbi:hypothetical protein [Streptomyces sp. NPDC050704]|uniref:hypothetical protein n=1 Tax=Streptomyces sp. NPDC050704 TaxID=3157219 RepID=UPI00343C3A5A
MGLNRRTAMKAGLLTTAASATILNSARAQGTSKAAAPVLTVTVQGEAATRTNIPVVRDRRASGGRYLALATKKRPGREGWYAAYAVHAPEAGVYALTAVATAPVEVPHTETTASYLQLSLNGGPFKSLARSQPYWYESKPAWGDLSVLDLGELELRGGANTLTFRVTEPTVLESGTAYALALDRFTLRRREGPRLQEVSVGEHGTYRHGGEPAHLRLRLDGTPDQPHHMRYTITDYFGRRASEGDATVAPGETTAIVALPELPPGNYRVEAAGVTAHFACLPTLPATSGPANRFGVNVWATSLIPPSRLDAFAAAMRDMGAGWIRDGQAWPAAEPSPGAYDTEHHDRATRTLRKHGLSPLEVMSPAPEWAMTDASLPLPADLRHAYRFARRLASKHPAAIQLSNEPDVDVTSSTGDAHAALAKAAALGIADAPGSPDVPDLPLVVLPGIAQAGPFQDLMLANDVVRYADVWAFHGYPDPAEQDEPEFPGAAEEQRELARRHGAEDVPRWMTECGAFFSVRPRVDLTPAQQAVQARYLVRSMVEGLAAGNSRQFWFAGPPLHDEGVYFGLLSREFHPLPAFSACAALTSVLGEAHFIAPVRGLPTGVVGFDFDSGRGESVRVLWATSSKPVRVAVEGVAAVYDVMGGQVATAGDEVTVSRDPMYVVTVGAARSAVRPVPRSRSRLSPAEHIVLSQRYRARNAAPNKDNGDAEPPLGYRLSRRTRMSLDVYNFTDTSRTVTVKARPAGGWSARADGPTRIEVPPQGRTTVKFTITAGSRVTRRTDHHLTFTATLEGDEVPPSVSLIQLK